MGLVALLLTAFGCSKETHKDQDNDSHSRDINRILIGIWNSDQRDELTQKNVGKVTMRFMSDGQLLYDINAGNKLQRMNLVYKINGDTIISNQPSHPQEEKTKFRIEDDNKLIMEFNGEKAVFLRETR
ncbi:hypothetical protein [Dyadobacter chenhuakuii]|uniref:Lipocalin-like protein n=1 Tax=Dyadobacter chenhuakuii TaxID=2909339 RepID=A0A9X1U3C1_9BACT|nr:hypothetical protein [Dyadobacter chenhuakuii]MCF2501371.1 hypothetical protein [Dyadobacter chenhuakuii]